MENTPPRKIRIIRLDLYVKHENVKDLEGTDFTAFEEHLRNAIMDQEIASIAVVKVFPVLASCNTANAEINAMGESIDFIHETNLPEVISKALEDYIFVPFQYIFLTQTGKGTSFSIVC